MSESKDQSTDSTGSLGLQSRGSLNRQVLRKDTSIFLFERIGRSATIFTGNL